MKKKIRIIGVLIILIILCYRIGKFLIIEHDITYKVGKYTIKEHFSKEPSHHYDLLISKGKKSFLYTIEVNLKKEKQIINKIKQYKSNDLECIIPFYKKYDYKQIYCNIGNQQVSNDYLIKANNIDFQTIQKKIKKYKISYPKENEKTSSYKKIKVYQKNILKQDTFVVWNYKGIDIINNNKMISKKLLDYDLYDNVMATIINHYYVLFENTSVNGIENIYYYNLEKDKLKKMVLSKKISKDSYINGVQGKYIYITDKENKKEYRLMISKEKLETINEESEGGFIVYHNGMKKVLSKSDFFMKEQYFNKTNYDYDYFLEDNHFYKAQTKNKKKKILLFELENVKEWTRVEDDIILISEDTIYHYNDNNGLVKILSSNELKYNYKNIYKVWKNE